MLFRALALLSAVTAPWAVQADTWLGGINRHGVPGGAYADLIEPEAAWGAAAAKVHVFKVPTQYLRRAEEAELAKLFAWLRERRMRLAMAGLLLVASDRCGKGIEGYDGKGGVQLVADRVKRLGGRIDYIVMDEPVWFGHYAKGPQTCQDSISSIASQLAPNVRILKEAFPAIQFGSAEPINPKTPGSIDTLLTFAREFQGATGEQLAFFHADIIWPQRGWREQLAEWKIRLRAAGIRLGVIFNGSATDRTDEDWTAHAIERYRLVMREPAISPDDAIVQTWHDFPRRWLPDSAPGTLTNIIVRTH